MKNLLALLCSLCCINCLYAEDLLLFVDKGSDHIFLGCFSCNKYDSSSIWNKYGDYGSKYSDKSIWNKYGDFGSKYSDYSPWNKYSERSPVLVDRSGNFYGYFTCNKYKDKRVPKKIMDIFCNNLDEIFDNSDDFRDKYFR